ISTSLWLLLGDLGYSLCLCTAVIPAQSASFISLFLFPILIRSIVLQTLLAFAVTCYGIVHIAGEFKDMDATSELKNKTFDTIRNHPSFYVFNHRGRVLFQSSDVVNSSSNQDALSSSASLKMLSFLQC
uniref:Membrane magnesium transporter 1 n=1 Tax=Pelusios castaneus TaxID=367368 RepID=A0A8C8VN82_9SAUR